MSTTRINTSVVVKGGFVFDNSVEEFPSNPQRGQLLIKGQQLFAYLVIGELATWYPLAARTRSYVHSQSEPSATWTVYHNLGSTDLWYNVYSATGLELVGKTNIDADTFTLTFSEPISGTVVVVAPDSLSVPTVTAGEITVGQVHIDGTTIRIAGSQMVTQAQLQGVVESQVLTLTANKADASALAAEISARIAGDATNAAAAAAAHSLAVSASASAAVATSNAAAASTAASAAAAEAASALAAAASKANLDLSNVQSSSIISALGYTPLSSALTGSVLPTTSGAFDLGSPTQKFRSIYTQELYLDANTLYVDGVPVISSSATTIQITADPNQSMRVSTTGAASLTLDSQHQVVVQTNGLNSDVLVQSIGQGSLTRISSSTEVVLTAPTVRIAGNLSVAGTTTQVDATNLSVSDNILTVNRGQLGTGVSLRYAGFDVDRGDAPKQRLVWDEVTGKWSAGLFGVEQPLTLASDLAAEASQRAAGDLSNAQAIASEISRAQTAESTLAASIAGVADRTTATEASVASLTAAVAAKVTAAEAAAAAPVQSVAGRTGAVTLSASDISGLASVATTGAYADLSGRPTAVSQFTNDAGFQTAAQVETRVQQVIGAAPAALDTLGEISTQLANDQSAVAALTAVVATKVTAAQAALAAPVQSVNTKTGAVVLSTTDIAEGANKYFTETRAAAAAPVQSVAGKTGEVVLAAGDITSGEFALERLPASVKTRYLPIRSRAAGTVNLELLTGVYALRNRAGGLSNLNFY